MSRMSAKLSTPFTTRRRRRTPLAGAVESISPFFPRSVRGLSDGDEALAAKPHFSVPRLASWRNFWKRRKPKQQRQRTKCCVQSCALFVSKKTKAFFPAECVTNRLRTLVRISLSLHDPRKVRSPVFYYQTPILFPWHPQNRRIYPGKRLPLQLLERPMIRWSSGCKSVSSTNWSAGYAGDPRSLYAPRRGSRRHDTWFSELTDR